MAEEAKRRRDVRIDQIGFAGELHKHFLEPLKAAVKAAHPKGTLLEGDLFDGRIDASEKTSVSADRWFKLLNEGIISRGQFIEAISVSISDARRILDEKTFTRISETEAGENRLTVTRKKGVEVGLVQAVQTISDQINAERRAAA